MGVSLTTNLWYGASSVEFHTIPDAAMSVLLAAIGDFRTTDLMKDYRHPQSEVILLVWSLVMGFIVLTMFVAIVDEGFQNAKDELNPKPKYVVFSCFLFSLFFPFFSFFFLFFPYLFVNLTNPY